MRPAAAGCRRVQRPPNPFTRDAHASSGKLRQDASAQSPAGGRVGRVFVRSAIASPANWRWPRRLARIAQANSLATCRASRSPQADDGVRSRCGTQCGILGTRIRRGCSEPLQQLVGPPRFELGTSSTPRKRATRLRHGPTAGRILLLSYRPLGWLRSCVGERYGAPRAELRVLAVDARPHARNRSEPEHRSPESRRLLAELAREAADSVLP